MKNLKLLSLLAAALLIGSQSYAADESDNSAGESSLKMEDVNPNKNKVEGKTDIDDIITNKKMRAEAGSKSKYSISAALGYNGGTIEKPFEEDRPNITAGTGVTAKAAGTADLSGRYRLTPTDSLSAGIGVRWIAPLETDGVQNYNGDRVDAANPYLSYGKVYGWAGGIQSVFSASATAYTNDNLRKAGFLADFGVSQNNAYEIGHSGVSVGLLLAAGTGFFDKGGVYRSVQADYYGGAYPFLEYVINDTFNLRTISGVWVYEHIRSESNGWTFSKNTIYQSVGLGISLSRNVFLYPNIQFIPEDIRSDRTNVALSANINLF